MKGWYKMGLEIERRHKREEAQQEDQEESLEGSPRGGG